MKTRYDIDGTFKEYNEKLAAAQDFSPKGIQELMEDAPVTPMITYYNPEGLPLFSSSSENKYYAFRLLTVQHNLKGYYCTVETEYWDANNDYQGPVAPYEYEKFYFNADENGAMSHFPVPIFEYPCNVISEIIRVAKPG